MAGLELATLTKKVLNGISFTIVTASMNNNDICLLKAPVCQGL